MENSNFYNILITLHGLLMIFFVLMPSLYSGLGNYFTPIFIGWPEVWFPRLNSFSFLVVPISYSCLMVWILSESGNGVGWTLYPPLSTTISSLSPTSIDLIIDGLVIIGLSSFFTSLNFITTIINMRFLSSIVHIALFPYGNNNIAY